jgi:hypothetical protein
LTLLKAEQKFGVVVYLKQLGYPLDSTKYKI